MTSSSAERGGSRAALGPAIVAGCSVLILVLYMGLWRGLWFDELLHFAMGGMTFEYAVKTVDFTTTEVNHGQTGVYLLLDWLLLQVFGASAIALRLPSLVSAGFMLWAAVVFMRAKGFGWRWQLVAVVAIGANSTLMFFAGEARPYMPMAASAVVMLAFYALPLESRRTWQGRVLGVFGFLFGAAVHPYWILMWAAVATFSVVVMLTQESWARRLTAVWNSLAPAYVLPALAIFLIVGQLTWMRRVFAFGADTDQIYNWAAISSAFVWDHFSFVPYYASVRSSMGPIAVSGWVTITVLAVAGLTGLWLLGCRACRHRRLGPPLLLLGVGVGSSVALTFQSYRLAYWIIERQWVAGMALACLATAWFFAEWWRATSPRSWRAKIPAIVYLVLVAGAFAVSAWTQFEVTVDRAAAWRLVEQDDRTRQELVAEPGEQTYNYDAQEGYEYIANLNVARGGPVWEEFVAWYNKWAGMRPEFREDNPGWSRFIWPDPAPQQSLCIPQLCGG